MHVRQLVTVLGLFLTQTSASLVRQPVDHALQQLVMLMTPTENPIEKSPQFADIADALTHQTKVDPHHLEHLRDESIGPILETSSENVASLYASFAGYQHAVGELQDEPQKLESIVGLYRSGMYGNIKAIVKNNERAFTPEKISDLQDHLIRAFPQAGVYQSGHTDHNIAQLVHEQIHQAFEIQPKGIKEMSNDEINAALKQASENIDFKPILIDTKHFENFVAAQASHSDHPHTAFPVHAHAVPVA